MLKLEQLKPAIKFGAILTAAIVLINLGISFLQQGSLELAVVALFFGLVLLLVYAYFFIEEAKRVVLLTMLEQTEGKF